MNLPKCWEEAWVSSEPMTIENNWRKDLLLLGTGMGCMTKVLVVSICMGDARGTCLSVSPSYSPGQGDF